MKLTQILVFAVLISFTGCSTPSPEPQKIDGRSTDVASTDSSAQHCAEAWCSIRASFYGDGDGLSGRKTASGKVFDSNQNTAAHRTLPFGTRMRIRNPANGREVTALINDRGPHKKGRDLDVSMGVANALGIVDDGVANLQFKIEK